MGKQKKAVTALCTTLPEETAGGRLILSAVFTLIPRLGNASGKANSCTGVHSTLIAQNVKTSAICSAQFLGVIPIVGLIDG